MSGVKPKIRYVSRDQNRSPVAVFQPQLPGLTQGLRLGQKRFASTDGFLRLLSLDALSDRVGYRCQGFRSSLADGFPRQHRQDAHHLAAGEQWKARKDHHAFDASPVAIAQGRIVDDVVRDVGPSFLSDGAYPRLANGDETMGAIEVRVGFRAGVKFEKLLIFRHQPNAGTRSIQVFHDGFGAGLKNAPQRVVHCQRQIHVRPKGH